MVSHYDDIVRDLKTMSKENEQLFDDIVYILEKEKIIKGFKEIII